MIILDIETSGVEPSKHSVLSIAAIDFYNPANRFFGECRTWNGAHIMAESLVFNGYTMQQATDTKKPTEKELIEDFFRWALQCKEHTTAGQNPSFDRDFLKEAAARARIDFPLARRTIDLHSVCYYHALKRGKKPPVKNGRSDLHSDAISEYVGIPGEPKPHVGMNGALYAAEAFGRLLYDEPFLPEFKEYPVPWAEKEQNGGKILKNEK